MESPEAKKVKEKQKVEEVSKEMNKEEETLIQEKDQVQDKNNSKQAKQDIKENQSVKEPVKEDIQPKLEQKGGEQDEKRVEPQPINKEDIIEEVKKAIEKEMSAPTAPLQEPKDSGSGEKVRSSISWLWNFSLFLPKGSIRALGFLIPVCFLCYLAVKLTGNAQNAVIVAIVSIASSAAHLYYNSKDRSDNNGEKDRSSNRNT